MTLQKRFARAREKTENGSDGPAGTGKAARKRERPISERIAAAQQEELETLLWKQDKQLPVDKTPLHTALERVRSGKSVEPTLEETYAAALPIYWQDTYIPPVAYAAGWQKVELSAPKTQGGYKRGGRISMAEKETDPVETDRREAGELGARLRLGEATDRDFTAYLEKIGERYGYIPATGSQEQMLEGVQSYLRSLQPKAETFAEQRAEGRDPLSRAGNTVTGAAKQYAGSIGSAASTFFQNNYENAAKYLNEGGEDPELGGLVDPEEYAKTVTEKSKAATGAMNGWADGLSQSGAEDIAKAQEGLNPAGRMLVNAGAGAAQMAGDAAVAFATGGSAMLPMMVRSFGAGAQEARAKGYSPGQQALLGLTGAATEFFSEKLFGGNPVYDSDVGLVNRLVGKIVKNPTVMEVLASAPVETLNEGLEEIASDLLEPVAEWAVTGNRPEYELDRIIEDGATGVLTTLMANGGAKVINAVGKVTTGGRKTAAGAEKTASTREVGRVGYDPLEVSAIRKEGKTFRNLVAGFDSSVAEFFAKWRNGRKGNTEEKLEKLYLGKMSAEVAQQVSEILGYEVGPRDFILTNDDVKHIMDEHGDPDAEIQRGNIPLGRWVFDSLQDVVTKPDSIEPGKIGRGLKNSGKQGIIFTKTFPNGKVVCIQFDNKGRGTMEVTTLYVKRGSTTSEMNADTAPIRTSETPEPVLPSDPIIPQAEDGVKREYAGKDAEYTEKPEAGQILSDDPLVREIWRLFGKGEAAEKAGDRPYRSEDPSIEDGATGVLTALMANGGVKVINAVGKAAAGAEKTASQGETGTGLIPVSETMRESLSTGKNNFIAQTAEDIVSFVKRALGKKGGPERLYMGSLPESTTQRIKVETGVDITGYNAILPGSSVQHIFNHHGSEQTEITRGQRAVTPEDIAMLPQVLAMPDSVQLLDDTDADGRKILLFSKQFGDTYVTAQGITDGRHAITTDTFWIKRGKPTDTTHNADISATPVENAQGAPPLGFPTTPIIPSAGDDVKGRPIPSDDPLVREIWRLFGKGEAAEEQKTAPVEGTEGIRVGKATILKVPYFGETPIQGAKVGKSTLYVSDKLVNRAQIMIEDAASGAQMGQGAFKNLLTRAYEAIFKPSKQIEVEGLTFQGESYYVDINKGVPAKVISDVNHSAEKLALLEILPDIVKNGEYVGSTIGKKSAIRYDHFETSVTIHKKPYLVLFETEVYPGVNNYKTHRLINMELAPQTDGVTGTPPAPSIEAPTPYNKSVSQTTDSVKEQPYPSDDPLVREIWRLFGKEKAAEKAGDRLYRSEDPSIEDGATGVLTALMANGGAKVINAVGKAVAGAEKIAPTAGGNTRLTEADISDYMQVGERKHIRDQKERIVEDGFSPVLTSPEGIREFVHQAVEGKIQNETRAYGRVGATLAEDVDMATDGSVSIDGYYLELEANALKHLSDHIDTDKDERNIPLTLEQVEQLADYIDSYDDLIDVIRRKDGSVRLMLGKKINGHSIIIEAVSKGRQSLHPVTAWQVDTDTYEKRYKTRAVGRSSTSHTMREARQDISRPATTPVTSSIVAQDDGVNTEHIEKPEVEQILSDDPLVREIWRLFGKDRTTGERDD